MEYQERRFAELFNIRLLSSRSALKAQSLNEGIVVGSDGTLYIDYCADEYLFQHVILFLENKNNGEILSKYAYYYLLANQDRVDRIYKSMKRKLSRQLLFYMTIQYPSITEQYEIVQKLDIVHNIYGWQQKAYDNLVLFPHSYYQRLEKATSMMWGKEVKLGNLVSIRKGKQIKDRDSLDVRVDGNVVEICGKGKVLLEVRKDKCNPYYLACALPAKKLFKQLSHSKIMNVTPLLQMANIRLKLPTLREQRHLEELYKKVEIVKGDMIASLKQIKILKDYYLHYYLYRKSFGRNFSFFDEKEIDKYSYVTPSMVDSLQTYDVLREELYKSLLCGDKEQYFDERINSVRIRKKL